METKTRKQTANLMPSLAKPVQRQNSATQVLSQTTQIHASNQWCDQLLNSCNAGDADSCQEFQFMC